MTVVIDIGAARYDNYFSMERLIDEFKPTHLYAYDPNPALEPPGTGKTKVQLVRAAAWTHVGTVGYLESGAWSHLTDDPDAPQVRCVDLAAEIAGYAKKFRGRLVLKLDCEGSEYDLLPHLIATDADVLLHLVVVEWHPWLRDGQEAVRARIEASARCEIREWWF